MSATGEQREGDISAVIGEATVFHNPNGIRERRIAQILHLRCVDPSVISARGAPSPANRSLLELSHCAGWGAMLARRTLDYDGTGG